jgi:hypothetical protein
MACVLSIFGDRQGHKRVLFDRSVFVAIKSAPSEAKRRTQLRNSSCFGAYRSHGVEYKFFIGAPLSRGHDLQAHNQGGIDTPEEQRIQRGIFKEHQTHKDIQAVPIRDTYMNLPNKLLHILWYAYYVSGAQYLVIHDDDYCMDPRAILSVIEEHVGPRELYAGTHKWNGTEYASMPGPARFIAPYFSGGYGTILSMGLVWHLVKPGNWLHNVMHAAYGTSADDNDLGKWVAKANVSVHIVQTPILKTSIKPHA